MSSGADPRLSILILTYNRQRMLRDCLDSVLPTTADCEIVVFDDASTDGTPELVRTYIDRDPRVRYFRQPTNVGVSANVETAAKEARGEFIALLADDDSVEPGNYERKVAILEAFPDVGFVYSLAYATDENLRNQQVMRRAENLDYSYIGGRAEFVDLISGNYICGPGVVFRRSLVEEHGVMDRDLPPAALALSDWDMYLRFMLNAETAFINEPLVNVRFHGSSLSTQSRDMAMGMIGVWRKWLVDRPDPPALDKRTWERMHAVFLSEVQRLHGNEPAKAQACVAAFEELRTAAAANASHTFALQTRCMTTTGQSTTTSLVWSGPVWAMGGMARDLRSMAAAAEAVPSISLRLEDVNWGLPTAEPVPGDRRRRLNESLWRPLRAESNYVNVWQGPLEFFRSDDDSRATVARVALEDEIPIPPTLLERLSDLQAVWAPSQFQCDVLAGYGIPCEKLRVLPSCVDLDGGAAVERFDLGTGRHFNFTSMVQLSDRGVEVLLRAFIREFRSEEDIALVLVVRAPPDASAERVVEHMQQLIQLELAGSNRVIPHINLRVGPLADDALAALLTASQAYVEPRPSRWGRGVLEAMACGVPVIGARIGGNTSLLSPQNSFSVDAELTPESLGRLMRQVSSSPEKARRRALNARVDVAVTHSPAAVGERLRELVAELQ
jgi:glycosyltransferase involved in cell wall biosynthesis